ncbi:MAG: DUF1684 domain-containing protein [Acidobacteriota bacterium]
MNSHYLKLIVAFLAMLGLLSCKSADRTPAPAVSSNKKSFATHTLSDTELRRQIEASRLEKDKSLRQSKDSPLPAEARAAFKGLNYFPVDLGYRFKCELKLYNNNERVLMLTSTGEQSEYIRYGYVEFNVANVPCRLDIFKPTFLGPDSRHLFIPFRDATSSKETYGAGRYLEFEETGDSQYILDFNLAYNPYCAYNKNYSCPIPPAQNTLKAEIRAGEKNYHSE